jgi:hypothetical protein
LAIGTVVRFELGRGGMRPANVAAVTGAFERVGVIISAGGDVRLRQPAAAD